MITAEFPAMGTTVTVRCETARAVGDVISFFEEVEGVCSRFRADSELSRVNASQERTIRVSPILRDVLHAADEARTATDGLVDAGVGSAVVAWGYDRTFLEVVDRITPPPVSHLEAAWALDGDVLVKDGAVQLDLGGIAKGWTCDRVVESGMATLASAGGDARSADPDTAIEILDPWGTVIAEVPVGEGALATSSTTRRRWKAGEIEAHHIIDPRTGLPAHTPVISATAVTATGVHAEAAAKAILMLGADGLAWADRRPWIRSAIAVWDDGSVYATTGLEVAR